MNVCARCGSGTCGNVRLVLIQPQSLGATGTTTGFLGITGLVGFNTASEAEERTDKEKEAEGNKDPAEGNSPKKDAEKKTRAKEETRAYPKTRGEKETRSYPKEEMIPTIRKKLGTKISGTKISQREAEKMTPGKTAAKATTLGKTETLVEKIHGKILKLGC